MSNGVDFRKLALALRGQLTAVQDELAALREELAELSRYKNLYEQSEKTLDRVHCMYAKRLLEATGERQTVLIPDEEFVKYFEEIKGLKQRLADAERRLGSVTAYVQTLCDAAGEQPSVATGYLRDVLDALTKPEEAKS